MVLRLSRRSFIAGSALALAGRPAFAQAVQTIIAEPKTSRFFGDGAPTQHWHFRTADDVPVVRVRQGAETSLHFINNLEEDIWVHLYGLRIEAASATALLPRGPAGTLDLVFTPPDAGTFWIGPLLNAAKQRGLGLYAMLIVEEAASPFEDVPLILDDWKVSDEGVLDRNFANIEEAAGAGRMGNWVTVNGTSKPNFALSAAKPTRLRLLNAGNARTLNVQLRGMEAQVIARDGQPIQPQALAAAGLDLAPGQRADIVPAQGGDDMSMLLDLGKDSLEAAFFTAAGALPEAGSSLVLPANPLPTIDATAEPAPRKIAIVLEGGIKGGLREARVAGETLDLRALLEKGLAWAINGKAGLQQETLFEAVEGEALILAFENRTEFDQPIAIDGHAWRALTPGSTLNESSPWTDTAVIPARSGAEFLLAGGKAGLWTISSLVAERSDAGLIGSFKVNPGP